MLAADIRDLPLEVANACLARVMPHDVLERCVLKVDLIRLQAAVLAATRDQVVARDLHLFFFDIAGQFDDFHAVA